ncbi:MAG: tripartite tricarboxylate transporter substrate-binding protein [Pseudomonadota bacterium]
MKNFRKKLICLCSLLAFWVPTSSHAQQVDYPRAPIRLVVAAPPGGLPDAIARLVGQRMAVTLGQAIAVENKTGAGAIIAAEYVARAAPDGYTLAVMDLSPLTINPTLYKKLPYDGARSFEPIALLGVAPMFVAAGPSLKAKSMTEFVAEAKSRPGKLTYGTIGIGSLHHIAFEEMRRVAGIDILHIPYREQPTVPAAAGQVDVMMAGLPSIDGLVKAQKLRILGIAVPGRAAQFPDVPTMAEQGLPGYTFSGDVGILAPRGIPPAIAQKIAAAATEALSQPDIRKRLSELGIIPDGRTLKDYSAYISRETDRYSAMVKRAGLEGSQ